jgi:nucleotide-binding universal stress UspA family protein
MYRTVIIGIDGTDAGADAVALARALAPRAELTLAHVLAQDPPTLRGHSAEFAVQERARSDALLQAERQRSAPGAETVSVPASGVGDGLHAAAQERDADLIVVGSCRRSVVGRVFAGDHTRAVLHRSPCPVSVAPRGYARRSGAPRVVGVAYDGSDQSEAALAHACALAGDLRAKVVARYVLELKVYGAGGFQVPLVELEESQMASARERLGELADAELTVVVGKSGEDLAAFSQEVDLLVCGSRQRGLAKRVVLGSTSDHLARHCACPLLVIPAPAVPASPPRERLRSRAPDAVVSLPR